MVGLSEAKNDIKILFLILNTLFVFVPGLFALSIGIENGVYMLPRGYGPDGLLIGLAIGLIILGVTTLGYRGAIKENRIMLCIYSGVVAVGVVGDFVLLLLNGRHLYLMGMEMAHFIMHLIGLLVTLVLSATLARQARRNVGQGSELFKPTAYTPNIDNL